MSRSSAAGSGEGRGAFYVELALRSLQGGEWLYYKRDRRKWRASKPRGWGDHGDGGEGEDNTVVKLNVLQIYALTLTVRPGKAVKYMWLDGQKVELKCASEDDIMRYSSQWTTTGYDVTKAGGRKRLPIEVEFTSGEFLKCEVQVKFYPATDTVHSREGRTFTFLSLLCQAPENTFVNVLKKQLL